MLVFEPHPALNRIASRWPVETLFSLREGPPEAPVDLSQAQNAMVTRPGLDVILVALDDAAFDLLVRLADRTPLGEAVAAVLEEHGDADIAGALALFLQAGAFRKS